MTRQTQNAARPADIQREALPDVSSRYGAPMGRRDYGDAEAAAPRSVYLFRMRMADGDYDVGGAYWGASSTPVFVAYAPPTETSEGLRLTVRASKRERAALALGLHTGQLRRGTREVAHYLLAAIDGRAPMPAADWDRARCIEAASEMRRYFKMGQPALAAA